MIPKHTSRGIVFGVRRHCGLNYLAPAPVILALVVTGALRPVGCCMQCDKSSSKLWASPGEASGYLQESFPIETGGGVKGLALSS